MSAYNIGDRVKMLHIPEGTYLAEGTGTVLAAGPNSATVIVRWDAGSGSEPEGMRWPLKDLRDSQGRFDRYVAPHIQLLNELYHDRARLERAVKDAVELAETAIALIDRDRDDEDFVSGLLQQFVDTHGNS